MLVVQQLGTSPSEAFIDTATLAKYCPKDQYPHRRIAYCLEKGFGWDIQCTFAWPREIFPPKVSIWSLKNCIPRLIEQIDTALLLDDPVWPAEEIEVAIETMIALVLGLPKDDAENSNKTINSQIRIAAANALATNYFGGRHYTPAISAAVTGLEYETDPAVATQLLYVLGEYLPKLPDSTDLKQRGILAIKRVMTGIYGPDLVKIAAARLEEATSGSGAPDDERVKPPKPEPEGGQETRLTRYKAPLLAAVTVAGGVLLGVAAYMVWDEVDRRRDRVVK